MTLVLHFYQDFFFFFFFVFGMKPERFSFASDWVHQSFIKNMTSNFVSNLLIKLSEL